MAKAWNLYSGVAASTLAVAALACALAGCGSSAPSCEQAIRSAVAHVGAGQDFDDGDIAEMVSVCIRDKWSAEVRSCVAAARTSEKLDACASAGDTAGAGTSGKRSEAELNLSAIEKSTKTYYYENAALPQGTVGLTPAEPCCGPGGKSKCRATASDWNGVPIWDALDFEVIEDHYYQYSYESDGKTFEARAVGDLDCDGVTVTYVLRGEARADGSFTAELIKPTRAD